MRKSINKESTFCDKCGKETYVDKCLKCGVEHCWECKKTEGIDYKHAVHFSGSGDGYYCHTCDTELRVTKSDKLHTAYRMIANLREEAEQFYKDFNNRAKLAEIQTEKLFAEKARNSA